MSDPVRDASKEATAGEKCSKRVMGTFRSHLCEKPAKVVEGGEPYCGVHDPEKGRKRAAAWNAKRAQKKNEWAVTDARRAEDARRLSRYDEAISLIEEFLRDGLEPQLARRADAFLAAEPKGVGA